MEFELFQSRQNILIMLVHILVTVNKFPPNNSCPSQENFSLKVNFLNCLQNYSNPVATANGKTESAMWFPQW